MHTSNLENRFLSKNKWAKDIPKFSSIFAFLVGWIVLIGWNFNIAVIKTGAIETATMKANTAVCFILAAISLWFLPSKKKIATACAIAVLAISTLTLSQYLWDFNIGIDELFFRDAPLSSATSHPGRMGLNTALNFILLGAALLLLYTNEKRIKSWKLNAIALAQGLATIAFLIALQALIGYAYGVRVFYQLSIYTTSMAPHTALAFIVLCIGLLFVSTNRGIVGTFTSKLNGGTVARRLLMSVMLSPLIFGWLIVWGLRANLYDPVFAISLLVILLFITSLLLLWQSARYLNRVDKRRQDVESELRYNQECLQKNIHDLKQATTYLAKQEQKYKYIFDAVGVSIWEEDFSEVKLALDELKNQGIQDFKQYFANNPDFVDWAIGAVKLVNVNDISLQTFGAKDKQQLLTSLNQIFLPETRETFTQELLTLVAGERFFSSEVVVQNLQGEKLNILLTIKFPPPTENCKCVLVTLMDIGERIQLEQNLQQNVAELTHANRVKDEFLAVLSHELRTPLNPILGWVKLLQSGKLTPVKMTQAFDAIERNVNLQINLVEDLLDISRTLHGQIKLETQTVDVALVIEAAIETVNFAAEVKSIDIQFTILSSATVIGDKKRLQQVFWHLLSNAIKFTPSCGRVEICLSSVNNCALISITDTGVGISPDFLPHIYEYFRQADASKTRKFGGLGLGLTIVKYLVELHGGIIQATSSGIGLGATFTVMLPLMPALITNLDKKEANDILPSLDGIKVLVVDDEPDNLELISFALENSGASVTSVNCGTEALRAISENLPDILVSDISMPGMDGYELLRSLLKLENACHIPSIALTAYADDTSREQIVAAGFKYHLAKPIDPYELIKVVARMFQSSHIPL
ncbi:hypothetical protein DSM106972_035170 [Dulcicalothrix desertica PCC 7102]|uniref:histidine kinase n=1 Tax=Dulcicalothrix desertica PCC 7102 TaxID=232991 RepID=A0A3S1J0D3_9CYAN|nr:ATP-binding protein [Dulcicalothrix desertica]RUT05510.1 hypothetical protein DSM106972_035170 [Dulcicalothrix desertica PCC 7102]TWH54609.1 signal transduction histidine kinase [Dulcicalothrix desertica PCC 7102]